MNEKELGQRMLEIRAELSDIMDWFMAANQCSPKGQQANADLNACRDAAYDMWQRTNLIMFAASRLSRLP